MKLLSAALRQHLQEDVLTLAWCCVLTRTDGLRRAFTSHDRPVDMDGQRFVPTSGFIPTDISSSNAFNVDNLDITAMLSHNSISEQDILAGRYDHARVEIFRVNWAAPDMGRIDMRSGWLGEISLADTDFTVEIRGLMQRLQQTVGQQYSPECRAILGSATCHADLLKHSRVGRVSAVTGTAAFAADDITEPDGWFDYGLLWWISGRNAGLKVEIKTYSSGAFALCEVMPNPIEAGDRFKAQAGCDKRTVTCRDKFDNFRNFRGEPMVPGSDSLYYYPGLK